MPGAPYRAGGGARRRVWRGGRTHTQGHAGADAGVPIMVILSGGTRNFRLPHA